MTALCCSRNNVFVCTLIQNQPLVNAVTRNCLKVVISDPLLLSPHNNYVMHFETFSDCNLTDVAIVPGT
jgi:hypothetical protein